MIARLLLALSAMSLASTACAGGFPPHPFVLVNEEELARLRQELAQPGWKHDIYHTPGVIDTGNTAVGLRSSADFWMKQEITIPGYGGHFHLFYCTDGTRLELAYQYPVDPGPYECPRCGKTYTGDRYEGAARLAVHELLGQGVLNLALVSAIERDSSYAAKAAEILLKYADAYPGPHTSHIEGGILYQSLNEAVWVIQLARAYDLIYRHLDAAQRAKIETFLRTVAQGLQKSGTRGNWASWHLSAVGVIGYATGDQELVDWALGHFRRQIREELGDDGIWPESIHTYHYYVVSAFTRLAEAARHAGVDLYRYEGKPGKSFLSMFTAPLDYAYPDMRLPAINDGWFQQFVPAESYEVAYRAAQDPRFAWVIANGYSPQMAPAGMSDRRIGAGKRGGLYAFLHGSELTSVVPRPPLRSADYPGIGICTLRSPDDSAMLTFHYGPFVGHGHPSKMSITLFSNGRLWAADYGTSGYGSEITGWHKSTLSHNTIVVDGGNQAATKERAVDLWLGDDLLEGARSTTQQAYPGVAHTRTVLRVADCVVIHDWLSSKEDHTYDFYLHADGRLSLDGAGSRTPMDNAPSKWITDPLEHPATGTIGGRWEWASQSLELWMSGDGQITPITAMCPAEDATHQIPLLIARRTGQSAEFVTILYPHRGRREFSVERQGTRLAIRCGDAEYDITLPEGTRPPEVTRR